MWLLEALLKARPRRIENRVAEELTRWSKEWGHHYVFERLPAMGRHGPDIDYPNGYKWVIDVKSRQSCPKGLFDLVNLDPDTKWWVRPPGNGHEHDANIYICRLDHLDALLNFDWEEARFHSVVVERWLEKMRGWAKDNEYTPGIGMLVLHKRYKPIGHSVVVVHQSDWLRMMEIMDKI